MTRSRPQWEIADSLGQDYLTGLPNRAYMMRRLEQALLDSEQTGLPVAVFYADVDCLQMTNAFLGHEVGDRALRDMARAMHAAMAPEVVLGRYGGGEFLGLLPNGDLAAATLQAEAARRAVDDLFRSSKEKRTLGGTCTGHAGPVDFLTVSVGVAASTPAQPACAAELLRTAGLRLYKAKREGCNRVIAG